MKKLFILIAPVILLVLSMIRVAESKEDARSRLKAKLRKPDVIDQKFVAANNWKYAMRNNGSFMYDPNDMDHDGNLAGGQFPRTENKTLIWAGGMYIATLKQGIPVCSEIEFQSEFQPGRIINDNLSFDSLQAEDPDLLAQKIYFIDRENPDNEWPEDAPRDIFDKPALIADAQTWTIFNDLDTSLSQGWPNGAPDDNPGLGLEVTLSSFAFSTPVIANSVIFHMVIINKANVNYNKSYLGLWADPDVNSENSHNDIVGIDTTRGLGFAYNRDNSDDPTAVGFDFLQGPIAHIAELSIKEADKFKNQNIRLEYDIQSNRYIPKSLAQDQLTLGATMFTYFVGGSDPLVNEHRYNLLKGLYSSGFPKTGNGERDYYSFRGNPLAQDGATDPDVEQYGADHRILLGTGPFTLPADSSQEIWFAVIGAKGQDRLDAVRQLFKTDDIVQSIFNQGLVTPQPPEILIYLLQLSITASSSPGKNNAEYSEDIAGDVFHITTDSGYSTNYIQRDFQGYRVYRSRTGLDGSFTLLAQYDKIDSFGIVTNRWVNADGHLEIEDIDLGDNTGLQYQFIDSNLTNTQSRLYSVTAYDAQPYIATSELITLDGLTIQKPAGIPVSLESSILANIHSATPMIAPASALKKVLVVPNPFYLTAYQTSSTFNKQIKFTKLPSSCLIKIFTVSGDLVRIIHHNASSDNERPGFNPYRDDDPEPAETSIESWDLTNHRGKLVASGMYIALVEAPGIGKTTVKFAVIQ